MDLRKSKKKKKTLPRGLISRYVKNRSSYRLKSPTMKLAKMLQKKREGEKETISSVYKSLIFGLVAAVPELNGDVWML